ncbi:MAG: hypothetical protein ABIV25_01710 [Paracoccaceae bacterium]
MSYPKRGRLGLMMSVAGWIFAAMIGLGIVLAVPAYSEFRTGWRLDEAGAEVTGRIASLVQGTHSCGKNNLSTCEDFTVGFDFAAAGVGWHGSASVSSGFYAGLSEGGSIVVRYVIDDPSITEVDLGTTLIGGVALWLIALGFMVAGGIGLWFRLRMATRLVRLRDDGTMRLATVTSQDRANVRVNGIQLWTMSWLDDAGVVGKSRMQRQKYLADVGAKITVYVDPVGKLPPAWEGDSGTR